MKHLKSFFSNNQLLQSLSALTRNLSPRVTVSLAILLGALLVAHFSSLAWGYMKDDAYISFRYARNLVDGHGLVFNPGERLEGYTNFLWTLLIAPFIAANLDPMHWASVLGVLFTIGTLTCIVLIIRQLGGRFIEMSIGALIYALWPPVSLWAVAGLEPPLIQFTVTASLLFALRARDSQRVIDAVFTTIFLSLACLTRPEGHAIAIFIGAAFLFTGRFKQFAAIAAGLAVIVLPYHLFRFLYFGSLLPNTFLVKGGSGFLFWRFGLDFITEMFVFQHTWLIFLLALVATVFLWMRNSNRSAWVLGWALIALFLVYMVKVGRDELKFYRLFLPVFPILAVTIAAGAAQLRSAVNRRWLALLVIPLGFLAVSHSLYNHKEHPKYAYYNEVLGRCNSASLGKFLTRHSKPGERVIHQDMGSTAYHAPDLHFIDTLGLVSPTMGRMYHDYDVHPFIKSHYRKTPEGRAHLNDMYAYGRGYLNDTDAEWVINVARVPKKERKEMRRRLNEDPAGNHFGKYVNQTSFNFHWPRTREFHQKYKYVGVVARSGGYWLTIWRRRDLLDDPPPYVVLDEAPGIGGPTTTLSNGVEILGGAVTSPIYTSDEMWMDVVFKASAAASAGTVVEVALWAGEPGTSKRVWHEYHAPGDWMWPAQNWRQGDIIRDRSLLQISHKVRPGTYTATWSLRTPQDLRATDNDGSPLVEVSTVDIRKRPPLHPVRVAPTDVHAQRSEQMINTADKN